MAARIIQFAKDITAEPWWDRVSLEVAWTAHRHVGLPVLFAKGILKLWSEDDEQHTIKAGTISIAKPSLYAGYSPNWAMDDIDADLGALASPVLDDEGYTDDFTEWCYDEFGVFPDGDPVFVHDIAIKPGFRSPRDPLAALAVLEAVAAFGSVGSPIIGFGEVLVLKRRRARFRDVGLWDWAGPLNAKAWKGVLVAARPQL